ncbi:hypothetical protein DFP73DRAFT_177979 [Morchella snyderi]|nr:hypothetical protein DFP73DRAFT_177979 [Morchella snyderi]
MVVAAAAAWWYWRLLLAKRGAGVTEEGLLQWRRMCLVEEQEEEKRSDGESMVGLGGRAIYNAMYLIYQRAVRYRQTGRQADIASSSSVTPSACIYYVLVLCNAPRHQPSAERYSERVCVCGEGVLEGVLYVSVSVDECVCVWLNT